MRILLISPIIDPEIRRDRGTYVPQLSLYILEGLTPPEHQVRIVEEEWEAIPFGEDCDLVGISCMTANAPRAYQVADSFRKRGIKVVLGGIHPTLLPEEALEHADCVVTGESEGVWEQLLEDHSINRLQRSYHQKEPDLTRYIPKNYHESKARSWFRALPLLTTKGCPYDCDFCSVAKLYGNRVRHIPVDNVIRDIRESGGRSFIFLDDNITGDTRYAKELFKALIPEKIRWVGMASIKLANNDSLLELASKSGCSALLIGVESIEEDQMTSMPKSMKDVDELQQAIRKIMRAGILFHASMIIGFDHETPESIRRMVKFLYRNRVSTVSFCMLTPFPGTRIYEQMKNEGRLITDDWKFYNNRTITFRPERLTPLELQAAYFRAKRSFYNIPSVLLRWPANRRQSLLHLASSVGYLRDVRGEMRRWKTLKQETYLQNQGQQGM